MLGPLTCESPAMPLTAPAHPPRPPAQARRGLRWLAAVLPALLAAPLAGAAGPTAQRPPAVAPASTAAAAAAVDPMDALREKLAAKLGAMKAPESASPYVLRVTSKAGEGAAASASADDSAATRARVARLRAAKQAAGQAPEPLAANWSYDGAGGPEQWGQLKPEFSACAKGSRQSPIDIRGGIQVDLEPIRFDYKPTDFSVIDTGHTVQVNLAAGNLIEVQGRRFELQQFHFHRPSEERINGRQFDMVAHLVHKDMEGRLAVLAVLLDRGSAQPLVQSIWNNLPLERHAELAARSQLDLNTLLPADRRYYTYMGSLTTPPCSEGVLWMVMQQSVPIAAEQIGVFSKLYPMNARPAQQAEGRLIKQSF